MKPFESQSTPLTSETEFVSCQSIAPLLMELFDGEADEFSAKRARAHLLACEHCAQAWLEWNQTQSILRTHPVPAPPPTLLWRIVLAARFANFKRQHGFRLFSRKNVPTLGAIYGMFEPHEAPSALKSQILAATSRQPKQKSVVWASNSNAKKKMAWPAFSMLAAPALAAFLLVVSRGDLNIVPSAPILSEAQAPEVESVPVANPNVKTRIAAAKPTKKLVSILNGSAKVGSTKVVKAEERAVEEVQPRVQPSREIKSIEREVAAPRRAIVRDVAFSNSRQQTENRSVEAPRSISRLVVEKSEKPEPKIKLVSAPSAARPVRTLLVSAPSVRVRGVTQDNLSHDMETPTSKVAQLPPTRGRISRLIDSQTNPLPAKVTRPAVSAPKVVLTNYDEIDSDEHITELQLVVADFRDVLSSDESEDLLADES